MQVGKLLSCRYVTVFANPLTIQTYRFIAPPWQSRQFRSASWLTCCDAPGNLLLRNRYSSTRTLWTHLMLSCMLCRSASGPQRSCLRIFCSNKQGSSAPERRQMSGLVPWCKCRHGSLSRFGGSRFGGDCPGNLPFCVSSAKYPLLPLP